MKQNLNKFISSINQYTLIILYKVILDVTYVMIEADYVYRYCHVICEIKYFKILLGYVLYILTFKLIKSEKDGIAYLFSYTFFALGLAPLLTYYQFSNVCQLWMVIVHVLGLVLIHFVSTRENRGIETFKQVHYCSNNVFVFLTSYLIIFTMYAINRFGMPVFHLIDLEAISHIRATVGLSTLDSIITNISCRVIIPLSIIIFWKSDKYVNALYAVFVQLYIYSVTGYKTFLFIPVVLVGVALIERIDLKRIVFLGLSALLLLVDILESVFALHLPYFLVGNRVLFFPALIKWSYMDFFSKNEFIYFTQNSISKILRIQSNYPINVPNLIGEKYFNNYEMWTNTGFISEAYSNLGIIGVLFISLSMAMILRITSRYVDSTHGKMKNAVIAMYLLYFIMLNDGALVYTLFSGGLIVLITLVIFINFNE
ncbi:MAG: hypothetical protein RR272_02600 [Synergistaceae bacterium]